MSEPDSLAFGGHPRNVQYTAKVAMLSNQTDSGIARVLAEESENFLERQYGRLIATIDVGFAEDGKDTYDISEIILDTLRKTFYDDLNQSVQASFEGALTAVNQTLADIAASGQNAWVGKLNAVIGVLHENEIHLSQVGSAQAYLVRGHAATHITEGLASPRGAATAKTFLNVASGHLELGDKLLVTTDELFYHLAVSDVRRILALNPPARSIKKIADLVTEKGMPNRLASTVIEVTSIDLVSAEPVSDEPNEIILGAPSGHFEKLQRFKPFQPDTPAATALASVRKLYDEKVKPSVEKVATRLKTEGPAKSSTAPQPAAGTPDVARKPSSTPSSNSASQFAHSSFGAVASVSKQAARKAHHHSAPARTKVRETWQKSGVPEHPVWKKVVAAVSPLLTRVRQLPIAALFQGGRALYRNLLIGAVVILALSIGLSAKAASDRRADDSVRNRITEIKAQQAKAETNYVLKDFDGARRQLDQAKAQATELAKQGRLKREVAELESAILGSYDRINNVVALSSEAMTDIAGASPGADPKHLALTGSTVYTIGDSGALYATDQTSKATTVSNATPGIQGNIKSLATTANGNILFLTDQPNLWQLDTASGAITAQPLGAGGVWEPGVALDTVQQNAFILEPDKNQIWRHTRTLAAFARGDGYVRTEANLAGAVDLVTGAQVYVLKSDGSLQVFVGGAAQQFTLAPPPEPGRAVRANRLAVNSVEGTTYISDPGSSRILEHNAKGEYLRQFKLDAFSDIRDIALDEKANVLFVLAGTKIYQVPLAI